MLNAETHLKDVPGAIREEKKGLTSYKLGSAKIYFTSEGQQPPPNSVEARSKVNDAEIFYKTLFLKFEVFEGDIPKAFENLAQNPIGMALLYRICIELLRVNDDGKFCFSDGTIREKNEEEKYFPRIDLSTSRIEISSFEQFLFFKLLEYFHELQPKRTIETLKDMLYIECGEDVVNEYISQKKREGEKDEEIISFLFFWYGCSHDCENYRPGDDLSLHNYRLYYNPFKRVYSRSDTGEEYNIYVSLVQKEHSFEVCLNHDLTFSCSQISDVFEGIYQFFYECLKYFSSYGSLPISGTTFKEKSYETWRYLITRIYIPYATHAFFSSPSPIFSEDTIAIPHSKKLHCTIHISVQEEGKPLKEGQDEKKYEYKSSVPTESANDFWNPLECLIKKLLND